MHAPIVEVLIDAGTTAIEVGETVFYATQLKTAAGTIVMGAATWTSSAPHVATVASNAPPLAAITAHAAGAVTISASAEGITGSISLRITPRPTHDLIYNRNAGLESEIFVLGMAAPSDPVHVNAGNVSRDPSPSPDGTQFVFAVSQVDGNQRQDDLFIVNRNGLNMRWLTRMAGMETDPVWSPDGTKILFRGTDSVTTQPDLWTINIDGTGLTNLTAGMPADVTDKRHPAWSPNGARIAFIAARDGHHKVWIMNADGSGALQLTTDAGFDSSPAWAPTGDRIAFSRSDNVSAVNGWDIMIVPATGGAATRLSLPGDQHLPAWSPDGEYIALAGTAMVGVGVHQLYTVRPDGTGLRLRTTNPSWGGGTAPAWIVR
jgi:TolB protein